MADTDDSTLSDNFTSSLSPSSDSNITRRSLVWKYFNEITKDQAQCVLCNLLVVHSGNTTNMNRHMKKFHIDKLPESGNNQPLATSFTCSASRQEEISNDLAEWIALDGLPLSMIESERFRFFLNRHIPWYKPPCRKTLFTKYILPMYKKTFLKMKSVFKNDWFSLTCDGWKARTTEPFYSLTFHCIKDFKIYNLVLTCSYFGEKTTSENINSFLETSLAEYEFDIKKCISITRDNAPNMNAALNDLDLVNFPCIDHSLNLVGKAILFDEAFSDTIQQINEIRKKFSYNHERNKQLKVEQVKSGLKPKLFPKDVETRWWSMLEVVEFFVINKKAIDSCFGNQELLKKKRERIDISEQTFAVAYALAVVCKPLHGASIEFEREDCPTISVILPFLHRMENLLYKESSTKITSKIMQVLEDEMDVDDENEVIRIEGYVQPVIDLAFNQVGKLKDSYCRRFWGTMEWATFMDPR